ncbi:TPA: type IV conjugative transfer system protein TraL [Legionella pneumophila]|uniref:type IV conjugative transfer system protein TraL n=1 Tax=Legionella pneumophila TaxID=446 RepID=UPI0005A8B8CE|nr:type IV conjugative transfer system protein TraL [Legionella pneumophila]HAT8853901.1 type IV conjugative transfer system protein TraL [Legionella pneumophila subsp. pneumophila]HCR5301744.1 type IV conjugative transfer system protein TraL [Legionella pneumophila]
MEDPKKYKTPQYLNEPYRLIIFTLDEVMVAALTLYVFGAVCGFFVTSLILTCAFLFLMKRMKGNEGPYFYIHLFYWFFSLSPKLRATPPSWIRSFLG